tara:strand:+ start:1252 stop:1575 length:324 start_codon:yes stop_codon:yes gene_type:complete
MARVRSSIQDFSLNNSLYSLATVNLYQVSAAGAKLGTLATIYSDRTGASTLANPQTLDSDGKWAAPVYAEEDVIMTVSGVRFDTHDTGIVRAPFGDGVIEAQVFTGA